MFSDDRFVAGLAGLATAFLLLGGLLIYCERAAAHRSTREVAR